MSHVLPLRAKPTVPERSARVGMIVFVGGWTMMFGALLTAYLLLRTSQNPGVTWPPAGVPRIPRLLPTIATAVLILSSLTFMRGRAAIEGAAPRKMAAWLVVTLGLAVAFLALQTVTWLRVLHAGLDPAKSLYAASFFGLTVFHALHVVVGVIGIASLLPRALRGAFSAHAHTAVRNWALYWHFVDIVWIAFYVAVVLW